MRGPPLGWATYVYYTLVAKDGNEFIQRTTCFLFRRALDKIENVWYAIGNR